MSTEPQPGQKELLNTKCTTVISKFRNDSANDAHEPPIAGLSIFGRARCITPSIHANCAANGPSKTVDQDQNPKRFVIQIKTEGGCAEKAETLNLNFTRSSHIPTAVTQPPWPRQMRGWLSSGTCGSRLVALASPGLLKSFDSRAISTALTTSPAPSVFKKCSAHRGQARPPMSTTSPTGSGSV